MINSFVFDIVSKKITLVNNLLKIYEKSEL